jgi:beta-aspartyl-peptidase (threonine type)
VLVHGGAGGKKPTAAQRSCLTESIISGMHILKIGGTSLDAIEAMIRLMEASGLFNAGIGSRLQLDGIKRMDAALMEGAHLKAGAVASIEGIRHPISAARLVMEQTEHVLLVGHHATRFARHFKVEKDRLGSSFHRQRIAPFRRGKERSKTLKLFRVLTQYETVGAVALDSTGTITAGTSTGGYSMMLPGRVGDSPLIGCGLYADNTCGGVSMTGKGKSIIKLALAKHILMDMKQGNSPHMATRKALRELVQRIQGEAGALVLAPDGRFSIQHTTRWMSAGFWNGRGKPSVGDQFH